MFFQKVKLEPGSYLVGVYAFLSSMTVNFYWDELQERGESIADWCGLKGVAEEDYPEWMQLFLEEEYVDSEELGMLEYIIRLTPLQDKTPVFPALEEDSKWCEKFEFRKPNHCLQGLKREDYL